MTPVSVDQHNKCFLLLSPPNLGYSLSGTEASFLSGHHHLPHIYSKLMEDRVEGFMATPAGGTYHLHHVPLARTQSHGSCETARESGKCSLLIYLRQKGTWFDEHVPLSCYAYVRLSTRVPFKCYLFYYFF